MPVLESKSSTPVPGVTIFKPWLISSTLVINMYRPLLLYLACHGVWACSLWLPQSRQRVLLPVATHWDLTAQMVISFVSVTSIPLSLPHTNEIQLASSLQAGRIQQTMQPSLQPLLDFMQRLMHSLLQGGSWTHTNTSTMLTRHKSLSRVMEPPTWPSFGLQARSMILPECSKHWFQEDGSFGEWVLEMGKTYIEHYNSSNLRHFIVIRDAYTLLDSKHLLMCATFLFSRLRGARRMMLDEHKKELKIIKHCRRPSIDDMMKIS